MSHPKSEGVENAVSGRKNRIVLCPNPSGLAKNTPAGITNKPFGVKNGAFVGKNVPLLPTNNSTKRELITFDPGDSGKMDYFAIRIDNGNAQYGPWCPLFNAVIP